MPFLPLQNRLQFRKRVLDGGVPRLERDAAEPSCAAADARGRA